MLKNLIRFTSPVTRSTPQMITSTARLFNSSRALAVVKISSELIAQVHAAEKALNKSDDPVANGPTAVLQSHAGKELTPDVISALQHAERLITELPHGLKEGPVSVAQRYSKTMPQHREFTGSVSSTKASASGVLNSDTISKITAKEKRITGSDEPVKGGPTAKAQSHAGEPITSEALSDITAGEKVVTGGERIKGGPTSTAQSELAKSQQ